MSGLDINQRLDFLKVDESTRRTVAEHRETIAAAVPEAMKSFYEQVRRYPEIRSFFSDERHIDHASNAQTTHWVRIAAATFDRDYIESAQRIGATHARIGLEPRWYIGGYTLIIERIVREIVATHFADRKKLKKDDGSKLAEALSATIRLALLDVDLGVSSYLQCCTEAELKKQADAQRRQAEEVQLAVETVARGLAYLEKGDLTYRIDESVPPAYEKLKSDFNRSVDRLQQVLTQIAGGTGNIRTGSSEISSAANDLSRRTEQQAASLEETAAALDEITATVKKSADGALEANSLVAAAKKDGEQTGDVVRKTIAAMAEIERSAKQITQIIGVIDEIAFQTNLLALNAGVEAARAGDAGRGFAVVATEVRALAQRSAQAAKEIKGLISESSDQVENGVNLVGQAGESLVRIVDQIGHISRHVADIANASQEQATALGQVNQAINQMDQVTQQNAAMVEQSTAASRALADESDSLAARVAEFNIGERIEAPRARTPAPKSNRTPAALARPLATPINQLRTATQRKALPSPDSEWEEF